ncbi:uncharacterized protein E0L32_008727 [Thyridium curvatum]|uniref:Zn(2)-C6 fungal-type domain-containing protein n=1 Tax=Thyridium curvatum TaxID=1093900 RepID=A0A507AKX7_9PEZI|nr:uncharacterized protein E0L32_008727 [Thyridium curvatum]TPX10322.1 hypothetical protein E0L32_008727 [Thyridium curvatum]
MAETPRSFLFAHSTLVLRDGGQPPVLRTTGVEEKKRKKRPHCKSRHGCLPCKSRRVKSQCDERVPCSGCVKRKIPCLQAAREHNVVPGLSVPRAVLGAAPSGVHFNLLHLELFHHWDKHTRMTLAFLEVWPVITQRAFHEEFIMSAILCIAASHLTVLCPQNTTYFLASTQLMAKTTELFRKNLSSQLTLSHYVSFLETELPVGSLSRLDLARDQLFLLGPGILQVWFQVMPVFIDQGSVFTQIIYQNPRPRIEETLLQIGENPARFVEPFMQIWDDPRYQTTDFHAAEPSPGGGSTSYAWRLLLGLDKEMAGHRCRPCTAPVSHSKHDETGRLARVRDTVTRITTNYTTGDNRDISSQSVRSLFESVVRRMSPLLCCASLLSTPDITVRSAITSLTTDIEQLFYGFPILCCGPFATLMVNGDSRALVFLHHFYRATRILLPPGKCWWAYRRSCVLEKLVLQKLETRGLQDPFTAYSFEL